MTNNPKDLSPEDIQRVGVLYCKLETLKDHIERNPHCIPDDIGDRLALTAGLLPAHMRSGDPLDRHLIASSLKNIDRALTIFDDVDEHGFLPLPDDATIDQLVARKGYLVVDILENKHVSLPALLLAQVQFEHLLDTHLTEDEPDDDGKREALALLTAIHEELLVALAEDDAE